MTLLERARGIARENPSVDGTDVQLARFAEFIGDSIDDIEDSLIPGSDGDRIVRQIRARLEEP